MNSKGFKLHKSWKPKKSYLSLWFLNFIEPCDTSWQSRIQCTQILDIMKHNSTIFWGSLVHLLFFSYSLNQYIYIYIYVCLYLCCGVHVLCKDWLVKWPNKPGMSQAQFTNYQYHPLEAQDPSKPLGLSIVQSKNQRLSINIWVYVYIYTY